MSKNKLLNFMYKHMFLTVIACLILVGGGIFLISSLMHKNDDGNSSETEKYTNEQVDVNGLTISEACKKVREKGWTVSAVEGVHGGWVSEKSDCSDTENIVSGVSYHTDKSIWDSPKVTLSFESDVASKYETDGTNSNSSSNSSAESSTGNSSSLGDSSSNTTSSDWKEVLSAYEKWVDSYVAFMKKYKNANSSEIASMMGDYSKMSQELVEWSDKVGKLDDNLSSDDLKYYLEVTSRCTQKMAEVANY